MNRSRVKNLHERLIARRGGFVLTYQDEPFSAQVSKLDAASSDNETNSKPDRLKYVVVIASKSEAAFEAQIPSKGSYFTGASNESYRVVRDPSDETSTHFRFECEIN